MTAPTSALPHWDMTPIFPSLESPEFVAGFDTVVSMIEQMRVEFDAEQIGLQPEAPLDDATVARFERAVALLNEASDAVTTLGAYISAFVTTDSRNNLALARQSELQQHLLVLNQLSTRYTAWIGSLDVEALILRSPLAAAHAYSLRQTKVIAGHLMSPAEEALASELRLSASRAWNQLYETFASQIEVPFALEGAELATPMSALRNYAFVADRDVRRRAYEAELAAWERNAVPLAAAMNSIKGEANTLARKRGWDSPLDEAIFGASIDRATLDAMFAAAREALPDFRRYLRAKARALGVERLAWYDLFAPVGDGGRDWDFDDASAFVVAQFGTYAPRLGEFAARAFAERWIDAEPRAGKRGGGFCMRVRPGESRILVNFEPSYKSMSTLAHELGHGYHNLNLAQRTPMQRATPMTLAETASIFCETIVKEAALQTATTGEQIEIVEASLDGACQVVVDIMSRFLFEDGVFTRRRQRELSVAELCALMQQAQLDTYGDGLDERALHPYMWAAKPHYYGRAYYNFPYMFGLLFGLGLYARYRVDPAGFRLGYDGLLSATGMDGAATLAARFGIDLHAIDFWRSSLDIVRGDIDQFERLIG